MAAPNSMRVVAIRASAMAIMGTAATPVVYQWLENPSASARSTLAMICLGVDPGLGSSIF